VDHLLPLKPYYFELFVVGGIDKLKEIHFTAPKVNSWLCGKSIFNSILPLRCKEAQSESALDSLLILRFLTFKQAQFAAV